MVTLLLLLLSLSAARLELIRGLLSRQVPRHEYESFLPPLQALPGPASDNILPLYDLAHVGRNTRSIQFTVIRWYCTTYPLDPTITFTMINRVVHCHLLILTQTLRSPHWLWLHVCTLRLLHCNGVILQTDTLRSYAR
jgi:hypothetical protein